MTNIEQAKYVYYEYFGLSYLVLWVLYVLKKVANVTTTNNNSYKLTKPFLYKAFFSDFNTF